MKGDHVRLGIEEKAYTSVALQGVHVVSNDEGAIAESCREHVCREARVKIPKVRDRVWLSLFRLSSS